MCGIVGVFQYKSCIPREIRAKALRILFSDSMYYTQARGSDATGVYQVHTNSDWMYAKEGEKVSKWMFNNPGKGVQATYRDFLDTWTQHPHELTALVGHCRKATIGSRGGSNVDNHPFAIQVDESNALLGCHNGTLDNHNTIFKRLPEGLERQGSTDSEIIFHLLWHLTEQGQVPVDGKVIETLGKRLDGAFACVVVNSKFPNIVATFRDGRPMDYVLISPLNIVVAASEKKYVLEAIENYDRFRAFSDPSLPALLYDDRVLADRDWRIFDTELDFPVGKPSFQAIQDVSLDTGTIRGYNHSVEDEWKAPKSTTATQSGVTGYMGTQHNRSGGSSHHKTATGAGVTTPVTGGAKVTKPTQVTRKKASDAEVVTTDAVVVVPVSEEEEATRAFEEVRSLGLCPAFSDEKSVAAAIGRTNLDNVSKAEVATGIAKTLFGLGYAVSRADQRLEAQEIRRHGRELVPKLELAIEKRQRAQQHIWTHKQLVVVLLSLARGHYKLDADNVDRALRLFPGMGQDNQTAVLAAFSAMLEDKGTERTLNGLQESYTRVETATKRHVREEAVAGKVTNC